MVKATDNENTNNIDEAEESTEKLCKRCGETKPIESFIKETRRKSGYGSICRECDEKRVKARKKKAATELKDSYIKRQIRKQYGISNDEITFTMIAEKRRQIIERRNKKGKPKEKKPRKKRCDGFKVRIIDTITEEEYRFESLKEASKILTRDTILKYVNTGVPNEVFGRSKYPNPCLIYSINV